MHTKNLVQNKIQKLKKVHSMRFRFLATVILAILAISICVGGISTYEVDRYIQNQAENFVKVTCANESAKINDSLRNMEKSVKIMESYLMDFFTCEADIADPAVQERVIQSADNMFVDVARHTSTSGAVSYYFRFDPSISHSKAGLFYSKLNGGDEFIAFEPTDLSLYEKDDTEHVGWFWQPYEAGKPIWMKPYHNQNNDSLMISYVIPMYFEDTFIGVVGMDFDYVVLSQQIHGIEIYENGFAHLEMDGVVYCSGIHEEETVANGDSEKYLQVSEKLVNDMTLVLSASYDDIRQIRYDISFKLLLTVLILSAFFAAVAIIVVQRIVDPLKKLTEASVQLSNGDYDVEIVQSNTQEIKLLSAAFENMTKRLHAREDLLRLSANHDSLTGLQNTTAYTTWVTKFDKEITDKNAEFGVVVLDLNELKAANDQYGHAVGDKLIVAAARAISDVFEKCPVFRIGGDEFLVVLQKDDLKRYEELFAQLRQTCANTFVENETMRIPVRIASGFARFDPDKDLSFGDVFKRADDAMYENKRKSKEESPLPL